MPDSEKSKRAFAMTASSCSWPMAEKTGVVSVELGAGLALCATTQMVQEAASVWLGWLWRDSAATVHSIRDRQSQADQRSTERICSCIGIDAMRL
jgi:hypothetical protein